jgi:hypothetical protein
MEAEVGEILKKYGYKPVYDYILAKFKSDYAFLSELFQVKTVNTETKIKRERKTVKNTVEKSTASTIECIVAPVAVVALVNKNVPDTPKPVVEQSSEKKSEKKPVVKKVINKPVEHDIIENEIKEAPHLRSLALPYGQSDDVGTVVDEEAEDVEIEDEEEGDVVEEKPVEKAEEKKDVNPNTLIKESKCKDASRKKLLDEIKVKNLENANKGINSNDQLTDENMRKWILDEKLKINDICRMTGCKQPDVRKRVNDLKLESPVPKKQQFAIARKLGKA